MPSLSRITSTFFVNLITRLGVRPPPPEGFLLANTVQPVSLVDADISIPVAQSSALIDTANVFSAGEQVAPAANTRLANTGPQTAGNYTVLAWMDTNDAAGNAFRFRRRNAADTGDVWAFRFTEGGQVTPFLEIRLRLVLGSNEFLVIENVNAGGVGTVYQATIFLVPS